MYIVSTCGDDFDELRGPGQDVEQAVPYELGCQ